MGRIIRGLAILFALCGALSLFFIPASLYGWLGVENDPLSGIFALILGLPWTLILRFFKAPTTYAAFIVAAMGILINTSLLFFLSRKLRS